MIGALGPQTVGHREAAIEVAQVERLDRGQLVDDHVRARLGDGGRDLVGVERVEHDRRGAELIQRRPLGLASRRADDLVAAGDQPWHELLSHRAGGACNEHFHGLAPHSRLHQF